ncbi:MAG: fumarate hydratase [Lentisphaeria bacterium]
MSVKQKIYDLLVKVSTDLPEDVEASIKCGLENEQDGSAAKAALQAILENIELARERKRPICQDTGSIIFYVTIPEGMGFSQRQFKVLACEAVKEVTEQGILRQNSVCALTGKNSGTNLGPGSPVFHFCEGEANSDVKITVMLKGGGSENVGMQYSLPDKQLEAGRDLNGVRKCILDAVLKAQGKGCAPGIVSVVVGGDRATGFEHSKELLQRHIGERNEDAQLASFEESLISEINSLGIGPMGLGGNTTILDLFIDFRNRVPASFFVSISYMCWAFRRQTTTIAISEF